MARPLEQDLDAQGEARIRNLPAPSNTTDSVRLADLLPRRIVAGDLGPSEAVALSALDTYVRVKGVLIEDCALTLTGKVAGQRGKYDLIQDGVGGHGITLDGTPIPIPTAADAKIGVEWFFDGTDTWVEVGGGAGEADGLITIHNAATTVHGLDTTEAEITDRVVLPWGIKGGSNVLLSQAATANMAYFARARIPKTGSLRGLSVFIAGTGGGTALMGVYDTGEALTANRTRLAVSGSIVPVANSWLTWDPNIAVVRGQWVELAVVFSAAQTFGKSTAPLHTNALTLPSGYDALFRTGANSASAKLWSSRAMGSLVLTTPQPEANLVTSTAHPIIFMGRIS